MIKVSIITPVFNSENFVSQAIDSVISQTYIDWEMILIDDCSNDDSVKIIKSYTDKRVKLIELKENRGAGYARNKGIEIAQGKFIAFLDSDDTWQKNKLEKQISFMLRNNINFSFTSYSFLNTDGKVINKFISVPEKVSLKMLLKNNYIGCLTAVYNQEKLGKLYMPTIRKRQDWALWLKILEKEKFAYGLNEILAYYRVGNDSLSNNKLNLMKSNFDFYNKYLGFGLVMSTYYFAIFLFSHINYKIFYTKKIN